jgi:hypothetical protein
MKRVARSEWRKTKNGNLSGRKILIFERRANKGLKLRMKGAASPRL